MSYFSAGNTGAYHGLAKPETPLMHDIVALQHAYGANLTTRTDDTVYGFNSNADRDVFHFTHAKDQGVFAIWDAGGIDTLDMSGFLQDQVIDLTAGSFSSVGGLKHNVSIAPGVTIENALGGAGSDIIFGNDAPNALWGLRGSDVMRGGAESDFLSGGAGSDVLYGDEGADVLLGNSGNDRMYGSVGDDVLLGHGGKDKLMGGPGNDWLTGGGGKDILVGGSGADVFDFNRITKSKVGGAKRDKITDFERGQDEIDLKGIDAKKGTDGNQKFKWIGNSEFHHKKGELRYEDKGSKVIVQGDVNGDGKTDFEIYVKVGSLNAHDFLL
ncbi:MAG: M10 family metallopeptidase C-terminal domain-containing protein [Methyloceanibacter sp.]|uniref:M10 family metallopeptidase C-terminal domain-containing protein n=1 Tax=Methyloceanibacter sp. TaxID=1965321 RepID=UPI003D6C713C